MHFHTCNLYRYQKPNPPNVMETESENCLPENSERVSTRMVVYRTIVMLKENFNFLLKIQQLGF